MTYIYPYHDLKLTEPFKVGWISLYGRWGKLYIHKALNVPGYGWIPCSTKLQLDFTNDPKHLVIIKSDQNDSDPPVTSDVWISRTGLKKVLRVDLSEF